MRDKRDVFTESLPGVAKPRGRPKTSPLTRAEQLRQAQKRHRAKARNIDDVSTKIGGGMPEEISCNGWGHRAAVLRKRVLDIDARPGLEIMKAAEYKAAVFDALELLVHLGTALDQVSQQRKG
jgi:hypothetical protein